MNRCLVLSVNETREQTEAIHRMQRQRQTIEGLLAEKDKKAKVELHQNAQRLLRPLLVANPFAEQLTFLSDKTRTRRDHMKYLTLIRTVTLLHQYQRPVKRVEHGGKSLEYIEVTPADIEIANRLAHEVLGRSLDELPPQTRALLGLILEMVKTGCKDGQVKQSDFRFSRKAVREYCHWGNTQLKLHLGRLEEMEYLLVHRGGRGQAMVYELLYQGEGANGGRFVQGLLDPMQLVQGEKKSGLGENWSGSNGKKPGEKSNQAGSSRGQVGTKSGGCRDGQSPVNKGLPADLSEITQKTHIGANKKVASPVTALAAGQD